MPLMPIKITPGIQKETPSLTSEPAWREADKIRFKSGQPEKIGGWTAHASGLNALSGVARSALAWRANNGFVVNTIGTHEKLYVITDTVFDITPLRSTQAVLDNPFDTTSASAVIDVNHTAHPASTGDQVIINHASATEFDDDEVNARHVVTFIDANSYSITVATNSTATTNGVGGLGVHFTYLPVLTDPFDTTNTDETLTVNHTAHGAETGDYVTFYDATSTSFDDDSVNTNHQITKIDNDTYTVEMAIAATASTTGTGSNVAFAYEVAIGNETSIPNFGWGAGGWGLGTWGTPRTIATDVSELRYWSMDHFGEDLITTYEGGRIFRWKFDGDVQNRAELIPTSPTASDLIVITNPDRHIVALASYDDTAAVQDKMFVRWADQETYTNWTPTAINTAGNQLLSGGSKILAADRAASSTLIWTDGGLYSMQFTGPPFTFGFDEIGRNCGAIGKSCVISHNSVSYWMSNDDFFIYDGVVQTIPCTVHRHVFSRINKDQGNKVVAGLNKEFHEVIWFYPTIAGGNEITDYVIYNYNENLWYIGTLIRTTWLDSELNARPFACSADGTIFLHEQGVDDNGSAITSYVESAEFDLDEGDRFMFIQRLIPDMTIDAGSVDYIFKTRRYPHSTQVSDTTLSVSGTTEKIDTRVRTRQMAIRIESDATGDTWRMGTSRIDLRPDGRR